jgi:hypothetical protein
VHPDQDKLGRGYKNQRPDQRMNPIVMVTGWYVAADVNSFCFCNSPSIIMHILACEVPLDEFEPMSTAHLFIHQVNVSTKFFFPNYQWRM